MSDDQLVYRFHPSDDGSYLAGVPQRDLTARDLARVQRRGRVADVQASGLYVEVKSAPAEAARTEIESPDTKTPRQRGKDGD